MPKSERKKKMIRWLSGRSSKTDNSSGVLDPQIRQQQLENQSGKYFQAIESLPLCRFIDCVVDNNIHALIITGNPPISILEAAFIDIYQQYSDKIGDSEYKHYINTYKSLIIVTCTVAQIDEIIKTLRMFPYPPLADELNKLLKTEFKFDYSNKEEYYKLLDRAHNRSRGFVVERDLLQMRFDAIKEKMKGDGDKKITRGYFIDWLIILTNHAQTSITDQITVYEFCERIRQYNQFVEREKMRK